MLAGLLLLFASLVFLISVSSMEQQQQQPLSFTRNLKTVVADHQRLEYEND